MQNTIRLYVKNKYLFTGWFILDYNLYCKRVTWCTVWEELISKSTGGINLFCKSDDFHPSIHPSNSTPQFNPPLPQTYNKRDGQGMFLQPAISRDSEDVGLQIGPWGLTICSVVLSRAELSPHLTISLKELINWNAFHYLCWTLRYHFAQLD